MKNAVFQTSSGTRDILNRKGEGLVGRTHLSTQSIPTRPVGQHSLGLRPSNSSKCFLAFHISPEDFLLLDSQGEGDWAPQGASCIEKHYYLWHIILRVTHCPHTHTPTNPHTQ